MLVESTKDVNKFILWSKSELAQHGYDYDSIIRDAKPITITKDDISAFISDQIDKQSKTENQRKTKNCLKFFARESIKTASEVCGFLDFLVQKDSTYISDGILVLKMNMDLYKLRTIVCEWEKTCKTDQYSWWSNPFGNLIAYQIYQLTGTLPFTLKRNYQSISNKQKTSRTHQKASSSKTAKDTTDFGVIYLLTHKTKEKRYVGQTKRIVTKRWKEHSKSTSGCRLLRNAIQEYGFNDFDRKVLAICKISDLNRLEAFFIHKYNCVHPNGYNITAGNLSFVDEECEETSLIPYIKVDEMEIEQMILDCCKAIRDAEEDIDNAQSRQEIIKLLKESHPDKSDDKEKNEECIELMEKFKNR